LSHRHVEMMKVMRLLVALSMAASVSAFAPAHSPAMLRALRPSTSSPLRMAGDAELVQIEEETIKTSTAIVGGAVGLLVGGPLVAVVGALGTNYYTSKNDNEATEVLKGIGQLAINFYNLALSLDAKYDLVEKAKDAGASAVEKVKEKDEKGIVSKVEDLVATTSSKFGELSDEYDLPTKAKEVIAAADSLSIKAIDGAGEINEKYALTDKALDAVKSTANKAAEKAKESRS